MSDHLDYIRDDYKAFLTDYNLTQDQVDAMLKLPTFHDNEWNTDIAIKPSEIAGVGLFTGIAIKEGEFIAVVRLNGNRYTAGRFTNHSPFPNAIFVRNEEGNLSLEALEDIEKGVEVTIDYRQAGKVNH